MTVDWFKYAQKLTSRPMKAMLTGPVTILNWAFVRDDQTREKTAYQIGLAIREEVLDLEKAGARIIQIDEAAIREGLPLKRENWRHYLDWAVDAFRVSSSAVDDKTQIQTHMCYSEFTDIMESIVRMDADVLLIEFARSRKEFFESFKNTKYPYQIGPGVYDIHSPRVPAQTEVEELISQLLKVFSPEQLWVNPDCGLKTRAPKETESALKNMVDAARSVRVKLTTHAARPAKMREAVVL